MFGSIFRTENELLHLSVKIHTHNLSFISHLHNLPMKNLCKTFSAQVSQKCIRFPLSILRLCKIYQMDYIFPEDTNVCQFVPYKINVL